MKKHLIRFLIGAGIGFIMFGIIILATHVPYFEFLCLILFFVYVLGFLIEKIYRMYIGEE